MTYKTISFTPKGAISDAIWDVCQTKTRTSDGKRYAWLDTNPQDLVRDALFFCNVIPKEQPSGCGDRSCWEPTLPVKTALWHENYMALTDFAKEQGMSRQDVIRESVMDYINAKDLLVA